jgi:hypothetical protein
MIQLVPKNFQIYKGFVLLPAFQYEYSKMISKPKSTVWECCGPDDSLNTKISQMDLIHIQSSGKHPWVPRT